MIFNTNKHKWHRTFLEVLNNHEIIYHMKNPRDNHYIIKQEYQNLVDRFGIHTETYKVIICPLMDYLQGYKKPIKGYRNYTRTDFNICYDLMNKYLELCKKIKVNDMIEKMNKDFV